MSDSAKPSLEEALSTALSRDAKHFGPALAKAAYTQGLAVTDKADGSTKPIPITATPVVVSQDELRRRQALAAQLSSAGVKMARAACTGSKASAILGALSPLERELASATAASLRTLVTTRVDFFISSKPHALEINATIPAMQGYSDIAANALIDVVGRFWGMPERAIASLRARNGSNALALYRSLLEGYRQVRPGQSPQRIGLLSRRNDAQLTEQRYLCERFREWGADAEIVHPDELPQKNFDLIYRHLFVRRLEEPDLKGAEHVRALLAEPNGKRMVVLNPPASQVEVKAVFAMLSQAIEDAALAREAQLSESELNAITNCVPWTRQFDESLLAKVAAEPDRYVLKRSWDYGGRAVFVGKTRNEPSYSERVRAAYGREAAWPELCALAAADRVGGGFVVQELVETFPQTHLLCSGDDQTSVELFVDFSAYASVGLGPQPAWGGVCRGSLSHIVNIVGGGGVLPLLTEEVARGLLDGYQAQLPPRS